MNLKNINTRLNKLLFKIINNSMKHIKVFRLALTLVLLLLPVSLLYAQEELNNYNYDYETYDTLPYYPETTDISDPVDTGLLALGGFTMIVYTIIMIGSYVFSALALQKIGKELNYKNTWFAWVPFLNMVMLMELGDQKWWLLLIPVVNTIFLIVATMKLTKKRGYDEVLGLIILTGIGAYILYYLLAWKPKDTNVNTAETQTVSQ